MTEQRKVPKVPGSIEAHAGSSQEMFTLYEGENVVEAMESERYLAIWDPVDLEANR
jgi:hypothetical protein